MEQGKIYIGQIGADIKLDTEDDPTLLAAATVRHIKYRRPDGVQGFWTATLSGTLLRFITTAATDLPVAGVWKLQAYAEGPGWSIPGETADMMIHSRFG